MSIFTDIIDAIIDGLKAAWDAVASLFSTDPVGSATQSCSGPLSQAQAQQLFNDLSAQSQIPFAYPDDCCYSRAHEMCRIMQARGIPCKKVWNYAHDFSSGGASLRVETPHHPSGHVNWRYRVAPVVQVRSNDGVVRDMVMDPSISDQPLTVDDWVARQQDPASSHEITDDRYYYREPRNTNAVEDPDYSQTHSMLAQHRASRDLRKGG